MIVDQTEHRCARSGCQCMIHESQRWCSEECRDAGLTAGPATCPCGHATCVASRPPQPPER